MTAFLDWGWSQPVTYDYDVNVVDEGDTVYFNGQPEASTTQYEQQAVELANPQNPPPPPAPNQGWTPLGVWALCQEEKGNADMFVQLSVNKAGQISGALHERPHRRKRTRRRSDQQGDSSGRVSPGKKY